MGYGERTQEDAQPLTTRGGFYSYEEWVKNFQRPEYICGWGAAFVNICATFPINKVMFRQQLYGLTAFRAVKQLQKEGIRHIYRGLLPPLLQKTTSMSLMFGLYHEFQRNLKHQFPTMLSPVTNSTAAMMAGTVEAILTPFERVQVLMQDKNYHKRFNNTFHAFRELRTYGVGEFYRGQMAILLRNGPSNVMFFLGRDYLMIAYPQDGSRSQKVILDFVSGAFLGSLISSIFYPLNVIKVRMQSKLGGDYRRLIPTAKVILKDRNYSIRKLFRGVHVNYTRALVSWGIVNATYEYLMHTFFMDSQQDSS